MLIDRILLFRTFRERKLKGNNEVFAVLYTQMNCGLCLQPHGREIYPITIVHNAFCGEAKEGGVKFY